MGKNMKRQLSVDASFPYSNILEIGLKKRLFFLYFSGIIYLFIVFVSFELHNANPVKELQKYI